MSELKDPVERVDPPRINVNLSYKMNLGNYESASVGIGITASAMNGEKTSDAVDRVYALTEAKLMEKFAEMKKESEEMGLGKE